MSNVAEFVHCQFAYTAPPKKPVAKQFTGTEERDTAEYNEGTKVMCTTRPPGLEQPREISGTSPSKPAETEFDAESGKPECGLFKSDLRRQTRHRGIQQRNQRPDRLSRRKKNNQGGVGRVALAATVLSEKRREHGSRSHRPLRRREMAPRDGSLSDGGWVGRDVGRVAFRVELGRWPEAAASVIDQIHATSRCARSPDARGVGVEEQVDVCAVDVAEPHVEQRSLGVGIAVDDVFQHQREALELSP